MMMLVPWTAAGKIDAQPLTATTGQPLARQEDGCTGYERGPTWNECAAVARVIEASAVWPEGRLLTVEEWQSVIRVAFALQKTDPKLVERGLIVYMAVHQTCNPQDEELVSAWTKPMLILRVMFELPMESWRADFTNQDALPCGGLPYKLIAKEPEARVNLGLPLSWSAEGPRQTALRPHIGGVAGQPYQPQREFRYMLSKYRYRQGLGDYVDVEIRDYTSLLSMLEPS
jgi:hypothetical protein